MKVLILGGTGAIGTHLVNLLSNNDSNEIIVTSRSKEGVFDGVKYIKGNSMDVNFLYPLLEEKWDCLVDFMSYKTNEFEDRIDKILDKVKHYVFLSSSRVYADSSSPLTENSPRLLDVCKDLEYLKTDEYALTKARQENILFENKKKNWTIIRPYITYSSDRLQMGVIEKDEWLFIAKNAKKLIFSKDISNKVTTLTYGLDVARGIASILCKEDAFGNAFHITGEKTIVWSDVAKIYYEALKTKIGNIIDYEETETSYRLHSSIGKYQVLYDRYYNRIFDNSKIKKYLDTTTFMDPVEGLSKCVSECLCDDGRIKYAKVSDKILLNLFYSKLSVPLSSIPTIKQRIKYCLIKLHLLKL